MSLQRIKSDEVLGVLRLAEVYPPEEGFFCRFVADVRWLQHLRPKRA